MIAGAGFAKDLMQSASVHHVSNPKTYVLVHRRVKICIWCPTMWLRLLPSTNLLGRSTRHSLQAGFWQ